MKRTLMITFAALLLLPAMLVAQTDSTRTHPRPENRPRFVDLNGDGINDLAPDRNGDGIPDALDPMFQGPRARHRMGWSHSVPDSVMTDSLAFRSWWENDRQRPNWEDAWNRWNSLVRDAGGIDNLRERWNREGMNPRDNRRRIIEDRRRPGGTGGSGGNGGGGNGNGGGGGRG